MILLPFLYTHIATQSCGFSGPYGLVAPGRLSQLVFISRSFILHSCVLRSLLECPFIHHYGHVGFDHSGIKAILHVHPQSHIGKISAKYYLYCERRSEVVTHRACSPNGDVHGAGGDKCIAVEIYTVLFPTYFLTSPPLPCRESSPPFFLIWKVIKSYLI